MTGACVGLLAYARGTVTRGAAPRRDRPCRDHEGAVRRRRALRYLALALFLTAHGFAQTGQISGRVLEKPGGQPLAGVNISLASEFTYESGEAILKTTRSLADGRFQFLDLPVGGYILGYSKGGYEGGSRASRSVELTDAEPEAEVALELRRSGVIGGRIRDPDGDPIQDAIIHLREWNTVKGRRMLRAVSSGRTDDRGVYRLHNLRPGSYIVSVMPRQMISPRGVLAYEFGPVSYANAPNPSQATPVVIKWGTTLESIDFRLEWSPATEIQGLALTLRGDRCKDCFVNISDEGGGIVGAVSVSEDGYFAIRGAQPGPYKLTMRTQGSRHIAFAETFVTTGDPVKAVLQPAEGVTLSGRVVRESPPVQSERPTDQRRRMAIQARALDAAGASTRQMSASVDWDGDEFRIEGMVPGSYFLQAQILPAGSYVREILLAGQPLPRGEIQVHGVPISDVEIRLSFDAGRVSGTVDDHPPAAKGFGAIEGLVVLLPDSYGEGPYVEFLGAYRPNEAKFDIPNVPPGSYRIFAVPRNNSFDLGDDQDIAFLRRKGSRVQVVARSTTNAVAPFVPNPD